MTHGGPLVYVGNRRKGPSSWAKDQGGPYGFGIFRLALDTGRLTPLGTACAEISVGMALHDPRRGLIYALDEALTLPGYHLGGGGQILALRPDPETGALTEISRSPSFGTLPSYAALSTCGDFLIVTHHTGHTPVTRTEQDDTGRYRIALDYDEAGTVLFPLAGDGSIGAPCDIFRHSGAGALLGQTHPQLHSVVRAPGRDFFVVCDKGSDRIELFILDRADRRLVHLAEHSLDAPPGSSPRYCVFHPEARVFYVNFETAPILHAYRYAPDGRVTRIAECPVLPEGAVPPPGPAQSDLVLHPSGNRLCTLVRGLEAVATFELDPDTGTPSIAGFRPLGVENARGAAFAPDGRHLFVAAVVSRELRCWPFGSDGLPDGTGVSTDQPAPGSVLILPAGESAP